MVKKAMLSMVVLVCAAGLASGVGTITTIQNGLNGYSGQVNDALSAGGWDWGSPTNAGYNVPGTGIWTGADDVELVSSSYTPTPPGIPYYHMRTLIRFDGIESVVPAGESVLSAQIVFSSCGQYKDGSTAVFKVSEALMPWVDGNTYWTNYGMGGTNPGYLGAAMGSIIHDAQEEPTPDPVTIDLDAGVIQGWIDNPASNNGMMLHMDMGVHHSHWWVNDPPALVIVTPEPTTMGLLALGALGLIRRKR